MQSWGNLHYILLGQTTWIKQLALSAMVKSLESKSWSMFYRTRDAQLVKVMAKRKGMLSYLKDYDMKKDFRAVICSSRCRTSINRCNL